MKKQILILIVIILLMIGGLFVFLTPKDKLGGAPLNVVIPELTDQQVLDKLVTAKAQLQNGQPVNLDDWKIITRLMTAKQIDNFKGEEVKVSDVLEK